MGFLSRLKTSYEERRRHIAATPCSCSIPVPYLHVSHYSFDRGDMCSSLLVVVSSKKSLSGNPFIA